MAEYIRRDELLFNFREIMPPEGENELADEMYNIVFQMAAYDVEPVRHGKWMETDAFPHRLYCSECYKTFLPNKNMVLQLNIPTNYCPNCGAKMSD